MADYLWIIILLVLILMVSIFWAAWSLKDLKTPSNVYPKIERKMREALSGVINLPSKR